MDHGVQLDHVARELDARSNHDRRRRVIGEKRQRCLQDYAQIRQVLRRFVVVARLASAWAGSSVKLVVGFRGSFRPLPASIL